ncbi:PPA1309 family protein [Propionibacteriaceae bacterium Y1923]
MLSGNQTEGTNALIAALMEIERHVTSQGWDQPGRLFALVRTDELIRNEPSLAAHLAQGNEDALSSVEQEDFRTGEDLEAVLKKMTWPASVHGCAIALETSFLPPQYEQSIPEDAEEAAAFVAQHEQRQDVRVVAGALRDGSRYAVGRLLTHPDDLLGGEAFAPGLIDAVAGTLT